ncbi:hypothetical protein FGIG_09347 [Fasciola gigantica]|uniref:Uncharacterized protein n=1 Tax=Fasciola gigantica TaxID=46835 RepID=A0A504YX20_FASGI|nr:hypothetical protein FGIG_09347 [Fasciola gigantica]
MCTLVFESDQRSYEAAHDAEVKHVKIKQSDTDEDSTGSPENTNEKVERNVNEEETGSRKTDTQTVHLAHFQLRIAKESMPSTFKENFLGCRSQERGENELQLVIYMAEVFSDLRADCHDECRTNALLQMLSSWNEVVNRHFNATADELQIQIHITYGNMHEQCYLTKRFSLMNYTFLFAHSAQKIVGYLTEDGLTLNSSTHHWDLRREQGAKQFVMYLVQSIGSQFPLILIDWTLGKSLRSLSVEMQFMFDVTEMAVIESSDLIRRVTSLSEQYRRSVKLSEFRIEGEHKFFALFKPVQQPTEANYGEELKLAKMEQTNVDVNTAESPQNIEENVERNTNDQETESLLRDPQSGMLNLNRICAYSFCDAGQQEQTFRLYKTALYDTKNVPFHILHLMRTVNKEDPLILIETKRTQGVLTLHIKFRLVLDVSETAGVNPEALIELLTILTKKHGESSTLVDFEIKSEYSLSMPN